MSGPLLAEAYSDARLNLDSLDEDIKRAQAKIRKAAEQLQQSLRLEIELSDQEARNTLKTFGQRLSAFKQEAETDPISLDVDIKFDVSEAKRVGDEAAAAVKEGFGSGKLDASVAVNMSDAHETGKRARHILGRGFGTNDLTAEVKVADAAETGSAARRALEEGFGTGNLSADVEVDFGDAAIAGLDAREALETAFGTGTLKVDVNGDVADAAALGAAAREAVEAGFGRGQLSADVDVNLADAAALGAAAREAVEAGFGSSKLRVDVEFNPVDAVGTGLAAREAVEAGFGSSKLNVNVGVDGTDATAKASAARQALEAEFWSSVVAKIDVADAAVYAALTQLAIAKTEFEADHWTIHFDVDNKDALAEIQAMKTAAQNAAADTSTLKPRVDKDGFADSARQGRQIAEDIFDGIDTTTDLHLDTSDADAELNRLFGRINDQLDAIEFRGLSLGGDSDRPLKQLLADLEEIRKPIEALSLHVDDADAVKKLGGIKDRFDHLGEKIIKVGTDGSEVDALPRRVRRSLDRLATEQPRAIKLRAKTDELKDAGRELARLRRSAGIKMKPGEYLKLKVDTSALDDAEQKVSRFRPFKRFRQQRVQSRTRTEDLNLDDMINQFRDHPDLILSPGLDARRLRDELDAFGESTLKWDVELVGADRLVPEIVALDTEVLTHGGTVTYDAEFSAGDVPGDITLLDTFVESGGGTVHIEADMENFDEVLAQIETLTAAVKASGGTAYFDAQLFGDEDTVAKLGGLQALVESAGGEIKYNLDEDGFLDVFVKINTLDATAKPGLDRVIETRATVSGVESAILKVETLDLAVEQVDGRSFSTRIFLSGIEKALAEIEALKAQIRSIPDADVGVNNSARPDDLTQIENYLLGSQKRFEAARAKLVEESEDLILSERVAAAAKNRSLFRRAQADQASDALKSTRSEIKDIQKQLRDLEKQAKQTRSGRGWRGVTGGAIHTRPEPKKLAEERMELEAQLLNLRKIGEAQRLIKAEAQRSAGLAKSVERESAAWNKRLARNARISKRSAIIEVGFENIGQAIAGGKKIEETIERIRSSASEGPTNWRLIKSITKDLGPVKKMLDRFGPQLSAIRSKFADTFGTRTQGGSFIPIDKIREQMGKASNLVKTGWTKVTDSVSRQAVNLTLLDRAKIQAALGRAATTVKTGWTKVTDSVSRQAVNFTLFDPRKIRDSLGRTREAVATGWGNISDFVARQATRISTFDISPIRDKSTAGLAAVKARFSAVTAAVRDFGRRTVDGFRDAGRAIRDFDPQRIKDFFTDLPQRAARAAGAVRSAVSRAAANVASLDFRAPGRAVAAMGTRAKDAVVTIKTKGVGRTIADFAKVRLAAIAASRGVTIPVHTGSPSRVIGVFTKLRTKIGGVFAKVGGKVFSGITSGASKAAGAVADTFTQAANTVSGVFTKVQAGVSKIGDFVSGMGSKVAALFSKGGPMLGPVIAAVIAFVGGILPMLITGIIAGLAALIGAAISFVVTSVIAGVGVALLPALAIFFNDRAKAAVMAEVTKLKDSVVKEFAGTTEFFTTTLLPAFSDALGGLIPIAAKSAGDFIVPVANSLIAYVKSMGPVVAEIAKPMGEGIASIIDTFTRFMPTITRVTLAIGAPLTDAVNALIEMVTEVADAFGADLGSGLQVLADLFREMTPNLKSMAGFITPILQWLGEIILQTTEVGALIGDLFGATLADSFQKFAANLDMIKYLFAGLAVFVVGFLKVTSVLVDLQRRFAYFIMEHVAPAVTTLGRFIYKLSTTLSVVFIKAVQFALKGLKLFVQGLAKVAGLGGKWNPFRGLKDGLDSAAEGLATGERAAGHAASRFSDMNDRVDQVMKVGAERAAEIGRGWREGYEKNLEAMRGGRLRASSALLEIEAIKARQQEGVITMDDYYDALKKVAEGGDDIAMVFPTASTALTEFIDKMKNGEYVASAFGSELKRSLKSATDFVGSAEIPEPEYIPDREYVPLPEVGETPGSETPEERQRREAKEARDAAEAAHRAKYDAQVKADKAENERRKKAYEDEVEAAKKRIDVQAALQKTLFDAAVQGQKAAALVQIRGAGLPFVADWLKALEPEQFASAIEQFGDIGSAKMVEANTKLEDAMRAGTLTFQELAAARDEAFALDKFRVDGLTLLEAGGYTEIAKQLAKSAPDEFKAVFLNFESLPEEEKRRLEQESVDFVKRQAEVAAAETELQQRLLGEKAAKAWKDGVAAETSKWSGKWNDFRGLLGAPPLVAPDTAKGADQSGDAEVAATAFASSFDASIAPKIHDSINKALIEVDIAPFTASGTNAGAAFLKAFTATLNATVSTPQSPWENLMGFLNPQKTEQSVMGAAATQIVDTFTATFTVSGFSAGVALGEGIEAGVASRSLTIAPSVADPANTDLWHQAGNTLGASLASGISMGILDSETLINLVAYQQGAIAGARLTAGLLDGVNPLGTDLAAKLATQFIPASVTATTGGMFIGRLFAQGLETGMIAGLEQVKSVAVLMAEAIAEAVRQALQINSPSRVMMEIGAQITSGLASGIAAGAPGVLNEAMRVGAQLPEHVGVAAVEGQTSYNSQTSNVSKSVVNHWSITSTGGPEETAAAIARRQRRRNYLDGP